MSAFSAHREFSRLVAKQTIAADEAVDAGLDRGEAYEPAHLALKVVDEAGQGLKVLLAGAMRTVVQRLLVWKVLTGTGTAGGGGVGTYAQASRDAGSETAGSQTRGDTGSTRMHSRSRP